MSQLRRHLKLVLWVQLLRQRQWGAVLRYYGWISLWSALLVGGTLAEIFVCAVPPELRRVDDRLLAPLAVAVLAVGYALGRWVGNGILIGVGSVVAGVFVITPRMWTWGPIATTIEGEGFTPTFTEDPFLFLKGTLTCSGMLLLTVGVLRLLKRQARHSSHRTLLRQVTGRALLIVAPLFLEIVRITAGVALPFPMPWEDAVKSALPEAGWVYALSIAAWLAVSYLWADYDSRILLHLLHRAGIQWAGGPLAVNDSFLVDRLLRRLPNLAAERSRRSKRTPTGDAPESE